MSGHHRWVESAEARPVQPGSPFTSWTVRLRGCGHTRIVTWGQPAAPLVVLCTTCAWGPSR